MNMTARLLSNANRVIYFHLKSHKAARNVVEHLITSPNDSVILPFTDYPGPLAQEILSRNFKLLTVCERDPETRLNFQNFCQQHYPEKRVKIYPDDLFDLSFKSHSDVAQERCREIVEEALQDSEIIRSPNGWTDDVNCDKRVKFLVPLLKSRNETGFLRNLYYQVCLRIGLCSSTLIQYYFLVSERQYKYFDAKPGENMRLYRSSSVLFNTIFNIKQLESFDLKDSFNVSVWKLQKTAVNNNGAYERVHLVCLEPELNVLGKLGPKGSIEYRFLVTQMMQRRSILVIDYLNNYFDTNVKDLAPIGITNETRSGDLDKDQYCKLFDYLRSREDYENSTFLHAAASNDENLLIAN